MPRPGDKAGPPSGTPGKPGAPDKKPPRDRPRRSGEATGPRLEEISGIGAVRARKLRRAGIRDVNEFAAAPDRKLRTVLGNLDVQGMQKQAKDLARGAEKG